LGYRVGTIVLETDQKASVKYHLAEGLRVLLKDEWMRERLILCTIPRPPSGSAAVVVELISTADILSNEGEGVFEPRGSDWSRDCLNSVAARTTGVF
jgi:hypothetical protein